MSWLSQSNWLGYAFLIGNCLFWFGYGYELYLYLIYTVVFYLSFIKRQLLISVFIVFGFSWSLFSGYLFDGWRFNHQASAGKFRVIAKVNSLINESKAMRRLELVVSNINGEALAGEKLLISCYRKCPDFKLGEEWRLLVKLKPPNGSYNPGFFDYERWLFSKTIKATGYLVETIDNKRLEPTTGIDKLRQELHDKIITQFTNNDVSASLLAMILGDRSYIDSRQLNLLQASGTSHLIAISGLHIGLAALPGFLIGGLFWRYSSQLQRFEKLRIQWLFCLIPASVYAVISGFGLPAQRALLMLCIFALGQLIKYPTSLHQRFNFALFLILLMQPKASLEVSFWLTFLVTYFILIFTQIARFSNYWRGLLGLQLALSMMMFSVQSFVFSQVPSISIVHNLWAIPYVSFILLPISMFWALVNLCFDYVSWQYVEVILLHSYQVFWFLLNLFSDFSSALLFQNPISLYQTVLIMSATSLLLLPSSAQLRMAVCLLILSLQFRQKIDNRFSMTVFDVGQGLSVLMQSQQQRLIYDTGFGMEDYSVFESQLVPWLISEGIKPLDYLVISHSDADHAGGMSAALSHLNVKNLILSPEIIRPPNYHGNSTICTIAQQWAIGKATVEVLSPDGDIETSSDNNLSCVLLVKIDAFSILISGDIEKPAEYRLLQNYPQLEVDVLLVPHHGSDTSSTNTLLSQLSPTIAINSSGYLNKFGFPKSDIVARYRKIDAKFIDTAQSGAIKLVIDPKGSVTITKSRQQNPALWRRN